MEYCCPRCKKQLHRDSRGWLCAQCGLCVPYVYRQYRIPPADISRLLTRGKTSWISSWKTRKNTTCTGRLVFTEAYRIRFEARRFPGAKCPRCSGSMYESEKHLFCDSCDFILFRSVAQRRLADNEIRDLLSRRHTDELKGFTAAESGKFFSCRLILNDAGAIEFDFT
ncbi:MAG: topoisomerase C-terminal repeat-containing protein [Fibrobacterota bacterium]